MNENSYESQTECLKQEIQQLRQTVNQLQVDRENDRKQIKALDEELSICLRYLGSLNITPSYTKEQLEQWAYEMAKWAEDPPPDLLPLSAFIDEVERLAKGSARGK